MSEILDGRFLLGHAGGSLAVLGLAFAWGRWRQHKPVALGSLSGMGMSRSNSGFIGLPIAVQVVGPASAAVGLALCMLVENLLMIPLALTLWPTAARPRPATGAKACARLVGSCCATR